MIVLCILVWLCITGVVLATVYHDTFDVLELVGIMATFFGVVLLFVALVGLVINRCDCKAFLLERESVVNSITVARDNDDINDIELAALQTSVIELNAELASWQYYNTTCWDIWIPDEIHNYEPIK